MQYYHFAICKIILFIVIDCGMQPSMRYPSSKLPVLVHQHKSYQKHLHSLVKIMSTSNNFSSQRSKQIQDIKKSMARSFCFKEKEKQKQIGENNLRLYSKIGFNINPSNNTNTNTNTNLNTNTNTNTNHKQSVKNPEEQGQKMKKSHSANKQLLNRSMKSQSQSPSSISIKASNSSRTDSLLLRNHRQSPITKLTHYERDKVNEVLASHIIHPYIPKSSDYSLTHLMQQHRVAAYMREKIRRFVDNPTQSHLKSDRYVRNRVDKDGGKEQQIKQKAENTLIKRRKAQNQSENAQQQETIKNQQYQEDFQ